MLYSKWNNTIQSFLSGKKVPQITQELNNIFEKVGLESREHPIRYSSSDGEKKQSLNRYGNVLPFNKNRVILEPPIDQDSFTKCDYINASHIKHDLVPREYIMCQGPLENTCEAFWTMVMQNEVKVIVMLGNFIEKDREKVFEYLPLGHFASEKDGENEKEFNNIGVKSVNLKNNDGILTERMLEVMDKKSSQSHKCWHFHFSAWSDFGVPAKVEYLETLINAVNDKGAFDDAPIVVHCSAGVGRSGVFVYCDIVLALLSQSSLESVSYVGELIGIRRQRMKSIQTFQQFVFALQVLKLMYPKVANWGAVSPVKNTDTDILSDQTESMNSIKAPILKTCKAVEKRKYQCLSDIVGLQQDESNNEDGELQAKKPPPCPVRTSSLMVMTKSKSSDTEMNQTMTATPESPVMFMTPANQSEKKSKSFFSLNKTDSKLMLKSKLVTKRKMGSSLRKNLITKFKKIDKNDLNEVVKPINFEA
ncbi:tyrosine-protein phosphatase non-receptor type 2-like [Symsagittifera roscoffensis]|uniref:tyrosine-protein phosphatase non-receptor type 2-like n=1 Tax=Symsagittifera roscoffensis TaxID=84072 RepID=UPI00307BB1ED